MKGPASVTKLSTTCWEESLHEQSCSSRCFQDLTVSDGVIVNWITYSHTVFKKTLWWIALRSSVTVCVLSTERRDSTGSLAINSCPQLERDKVTGQNDCFKWFFQLFESMIAALTRVSLRDELWQKRSPYTRCLVYRRRGRKEYSYNRRQAKVESEEESRRMGLIMKSSVFQLKRKNT